jgi:hypothetical protein
VTSGASAATFTIGGISPSPVPATGQPDGVLPVTSWTAPISFNADVLSSVPGNDANCVKYNGLVLNGNGYYYGKETLPGSGWMTPKYNDQFSAAVHDTDDFFSYDGRLFDSDHSNDGSRNLNADGHITLSTERPNRTLVILNRAAR